MEFFFVENVSIYIRSVDDETMSTYKVCSSKIAITYTYYAIPVARVQATISLFLQLYK